MSIGFQLKLDPNLRTELRKFTTELQTKIERRAWKKALTPIAEQAAAHAPKSGGDRTHHRGLAANIEVTVWSKHNFVTGRVSAVAPHAHLLEYGHRMVGHKKGGGPGEVSTKTPFVGPKPDERGFMRRAMDERGELAVEIFSSEVIKAIETEGSK